MLLVSEPVLGEQEQSALCEVIESGWIAMGPRVRSFEEAFASAHGMHDCVAVSSCTAALHLILLAAGIGPGDEVLVPSLTFAATVNAILYVGATPIFVDIDSLENPIVSADRAEEMCTSRTRAAIVVHYAGELVDQNAWRNFARRKSLFLIEDSAHAVGFPGPGTIGDAAAFSFYANKNMTTAEGGMIFARDHGLTDRIRLMRAHGMTSGTFDRLNSRSPHYDVVLLGFNYRLDELRAAIGLVQLARLPERNAARYALSAVYRAMIKQQCPNVTVPFSCRPPVAPHIMPVVLPRGVDRDRVISDLRNNGIQTTIHYSPVHNLTYYRERFPCCHQLKITEEYAQRELTLPLHSGMRLADVERAVEALVAALADQSRSLSAL